MTNNVIDSNNFSKETQSDPKKQEKLCNQVICHNKYHSFIY